MTIDRTTMTVAREELYDIVWNDPMWTVAPRYGPSDVGLAKACRRHKIPVPGRGYWQQKQAGQRVPQTRLPKLSATQSEALGTITFSVHERRPEETRDVIQPPLIVVPEILTDPHPLVEHTVRALRRVRPTKEGLLPQTGAADYLDVRVSLDTVDRAMRMLDALAKATDVQGFSIRIAIDEGRATTRAVVMDEEVPFHVEESVDQVTVELPAAKARDPWAPTTRAKAVPSGELGFYVDASWYYASRSVRVTWRDGKRQRLENCLGAIVVSFVEARTRSGRIGKRGRSRNANGRRGNGSVASPLGKHGSTSGDAKRSMSCPGNSTA